MMKLAALMLVLILYTTAASAAHDLTITPEIAHCGNSILESSEQCDDGNLDNGDGCSANCITELCEAPIVIDLNEYATGEIIDTQNPFFTVSCDNNHGGQPDECIIFNSSDPSGDDHDLGTPHTDHGGPGIGFGGGAGHGNTRALGNVLIIPEDLHDGNDDDLVDDPDDTGSGGTMVFVLSDFVRVQEISVVDIEEHGGSISTAGGALPLPGIGDNSVQTLAVDNVTDVIVVELVGSGGLGEFTYCELDECGNGIKEGDEQCDGQDGVGEYQICNEHCEIEELTCIDAIDQNLLTATVSGGTVTIHNDAPFSYDVGTAVYEKFDEIIDNQILFDFNDSVVEANSELELLLNLPQCKYQLDVYCGEVLPSLDGFRYAERLITARHLGDEYCSEVICGDGIVNQEGEQCDGEDGVGPHQECSVQCELINKTYCGDGIVQQPNDGGGYEQCDGQDGIGENQACSEQCTLVNLTYCGDGIVQQPNDHNEFEQCDGSDGVGEYQECTEQCTLVNLTYCGDGIVQLPNEKGEGGPLNDGYEQCDGQDGIGENQACSEQCTLVNLTYCGDGIVQQPNDYNEFEQCDSSDGVGAHQECNDQCELINKTYCGDGIVQSPNDDGQYEQCDGQDGISEGEQCTAQCTIDRDFEIWLNHKWNLISIPYQPEDSHPESVFYNMSDDILSIWYYDPFVDQWFVYTPNGIDDDDLLSIDVGKGYWVLVNQTEGLRLSINGTLFSEAVLPPGVAVKGDAWNLIGYYGSDGLFEYHGPQGNGDSVLCHLNSLRNRLIDFAELSLWTYWEPYNPHQWIPVGEYQTITNMDPGAGYWVFAAQDALYAPPTTCGII